MARGKLVTHYDNLKVARNAPPEVIRAAYRALAQQFHPDKFPDRILAEHRMKIINAAYEVLSDPDRRREHDAWIDEQERDETFSKDIGKSERQNEQPRESYKKASSGHEFNDQERFRKSSSDETGFSASGVYMQRNKSTSWSEIALGILLLPIFLIAEGAKWIRANCPRAAGNRQQHQPGEQKNDDEFRFWHVLLLCILGGWYLAYRANPQYAQLSFFDRLFDAGYIGIVMGIALPIVGLACFGWAVAMLIKPARAYASWMALGFSVTFFVLLNMGTDIMERRASRQNADSPRAAAKPLPGMEPNRITQEKSTNAEVTQGRRKPDSTSVTGTNVTAQASPRTVVKHDSPTISIARPTIKAPKHPDLMTALMSSDTESMMHFLSLGADINQRTSTGLTYLIVAVQREDMGMVRFLLDNGANVDKPDFRGHTPIAHALTARIPNAELIKYLENHGARSPYAVH